jgi:hypothetical protein
LLTVAREYAQSGGLDDRSSDGIRIEETATHEDDAKNRPGDPARILVLGTGQMGSGIVRAILETPGLELVGAWAVQCVSGPKANRRVRVSVKVERNPAEPRTCVVDRRHMRNRRT